MIRSVMIQFCRGLLGLSYLVLYVRACHLLFGRTATLIIVGVQLLLAGWLVWSMIRAPD